MQVIDDALLAEFRAAGRCSWCNQPTPSGCHPHHHVVRKGMGCGSRLDVRPNLVALCWRCHDAHHNGHRPLYCDLLTVIATREGLLQSEVERAVLRLRRTPKECSPCPRCEGRGLYWRPGYGVPCAVCSGSGILDALGEPWDGGDDEQQIGTADADTPGHLSGDHGEGQDDGLPRGADRRRSRRGDPADVEAHEDAGGWVAF